MPELFNRADYLGFAMALPLFFMAFPSFFHCFAWFALPNRASPGCQAPQTRSIRGSAHFHQELSILLGHHRREALGLASLNMLEPTSSSKIFSLNPTLYDLM